MLEVSIANEINLIKEVKIWGRQVRITDLVAATT